jgi:hypothetical protein
MSISPSSTSPISSSGTSVAAAAVGGSEEEEEAALGLSGEPGGVVEAGMRSYSVVASWVQCAMESYIQAGWTMETCWW